jgi:hypothetical protein
VPVQALRVLEGDHRAAPAVARERGQEGGASGGHGGTGGVGNLGEDGAAQRTGRRRGRGTLQQLAAVDHA